VGRVLPYGYGSGSRFGLILTDIVTQCMGSWDEKAGYIFPTQEIVAA